MLKNAPGKEIQMDRGLNTETKQRTGMAHSWNIQIMGRGGLEKLHPL